MLIQSATPQGDTATTHHQTEPTLKTYTVKSQPIPHPSTSFALAGVRANHPGFPRKNPPKNQNPSSAHPILRACGSICSKLGFRFQANIPPGPTRDTKQKPSLELMQPTKQGFCFSWDSAWQLRFTQEETSQKPEPKLKQTRSSTCRTRWRQRSEAGQPSELLKSLESLGFPKSAGCSFSTDPAGSTAPATPSIWEVNNSVNSPPLA